MIARTSTAKRRDEDDQADREPQDEEGPVVLGDRNEEIEQHDQGGFEQGPEPRDWRSGGVR